MNFTKSSPTSTPEPLAVSPVEAARLTGVGRTTIYLALGSGALPSMKIGKRRLIAIEALRAWLLSHEVVRPWTVDRMLDVFLLCSGMPRLDYVGQWERQINSPGRWPRHKTQCKEIVVAQALLEFAIEVHKQKWPSTEGTVEGSKTSPREGSFGDDAAMKHRQFQNKRNYFGSQARARLGLDHDRCAPATSAKQSRLQPLPSPDCDVAGLDATTNAFRQQAMANEYRLVRIKPFHHGSQWALPCSSTTSHPSSGAPQSNPWAR
jgi:excisionase family DNA binding protein